MNFIFSPYIVPVAGCLVGIVAIVAGIWLDGHKRRIKSEERIAMISRGVPLAEIEKMLGAGDERPPVKDPLRSLGNARRTGIVLVSVGVGLTLFFVTLSLILQERDVLAGAAIGIIPFAIGIGFFIDYHLQKRELSRFGLEVGAEPGSGLDR
ncbi:MAG: DUF6249 domain-containing protein [Edaphobacter sp.]